MILNQNTFIGGYTTMAEIKIKHMVCPRCVTAVQQVLEKSDIPYRSVEMGKVNLVQMPSAERMDLLEEELEGLGFELLKDRDSQKIEKIKNLLHAQLRLEEIPQGVFISQIVTENLMEDYAGLSHLFSTMEGITIEKYFILLKIEKVKEFLFYEELTLSEMAWKLGYSSVQHLSSQFKKVTGLTPTAYKKLKDKNNYGFHHIGLS